jgi:predicted nucleic acid-binding protein
MSSTAVIDASAFLWAALGHEAATEWIERVRNRGVSAVAPDLIYVEAGNGLLVYVRARALSLEAAEAILDALRRLPIRTVPLRELAVPALRVANERGLSVSDACYVALADEANAVLVTADGAAAEAATESILLD